MLIFSGDPGSDGAICVLRDAHPLIHLAEWSRADGDIIATVRRLIDAHGKPDVAYVEDGLVAPTVDRGRMRSTATYHQNVGAMHAAFESLGCRVVVVAPQKWQRAMGFAHLWGASKAARKREIHRVALTLVVGAGAVPIYAGDSVAIGAFGVTEERVRRSSTAALPRN